jgi:hypothetical protein
VTGSNRWGQLGEPQYVKHLNVFTKLKLSLGRVFAVCCGERMTAVATTGGLYVAGISAGNYHELIFDRESCMAGFALVSGTMGHEKLCLAEERKKRPVDAEVVDSTSPSKKPRLESPAVTTV